MGSKIDLAGSRFDRLVVIEEAGRLGGGVAWRCLCDCGKFTVTKSASLRTGVTRSCGCLAVETASRIRNDLRGKRFGRLMVAEELAKRNKSRNIVWSCICDCGASTEVDSHSLSSGNTRSCGCLIGETVSRRLSEESSTRREMTIDPLSYPYDKDSFNLESFVMSTCVGHHDKDPARFRDSKGYVFVVCPKHPSSGRNGYMREHVLVMSHVLGRPLKKGEMVHHKNGIRNDNRPENLELCEAFQPPGQRVEDKVEWCKEWLSQHISKEDLVSWVGSL